MVQRQITGWDHFAAVLAGIAVTQQDVLAREGPGLVRNASILQQANHRRHAHGDPRCMQGVSIFFLRHGQPFQDQDNGAASGTNIDWLVGSIQHQHRSLHQQALAWRRRLRRRHIRMMASVSSSVPFKHGLVVPPERELPALRP